MKGDVGQKCFWATLHVFGLKCDSIGHYCTSFWAVLHVFGLKCF